MSITQRCAAPGCTNPVDHPAGRPGRPPIYCSPDCRPSRAGAPHGRRCLIVEVVPDDTDQRTGRDWQVRLRRGCEIVTIRTDLGYPSARAFGRELARMLSATRRVTQQPETLPNGGAIE